MSFSRSSSMAGMLSARRDSDGSPVDWWFIYKLPGDVGSPKTTGFEYLHYDAETSGAPAMAKTTLDQKTGALEATLQAIFSPQDGDSSWILYNDEAPGTTPSGGSPKIRSSPGWRWAT